jgi:hypothetical protein
MRPINKRLLSIISGSFKSYFDLYNKTTISNKNVKEASLYISSQLQGVIKQQFIEELQTESNVVMLDEELQRILEIYKTQKDQIKYLVKKNKELEQKLKDVEVTNGI